ncbi:hypothetical protein [Microcoleus sp. EPA2]|uniref:hypothetical protein n=1 Tax=Microcoleus sp. EPA2 TaxID=2841654 RepID=UPI00312B8755
MWLLPFELQLVRILLILTYPFFLCCHCGTGKIACAWEVTPIHCGTGQKASAMDRFQKARSPLMTKSAIALFNS